MRTLVLVFHPDLEGASRANKALVRAARELPGGAVTVRDVYALYPDGVIDVAAEQRLVEAHDRIVLEFPMYWYSAPALLKEWEDKVLAFGWAYGPGGEALQGKEIAVATTAGGPESEYVEEDDGATMREVLSPLPDDGPLHARRVARPVRRLRIHGAVRRGVGRGGPKVPGVPRRLTTLISPRPGHDPPPSPFPLVR